MTEVKQVKTSEGASTVMRDMVMSPGNPEQQQARIEARQAPQFLTRKPRIRPSIAAKLRGEKL
jgi:hypothetical protein